MPVRKVHIHPRLRGRHQKGERKSAKKTYTSLAPQDQAAFTPGGDCTGDMASKTSGDSSLNEDGENIKTKVQPFVKHSVPTIEEDASGSLLASEFDKATTGMLLDSPMSEPIRFVDENNNEVPYCSSIGEMEHTSQAGVNLQINQPLQSQAFLEHPPKSRFTSVSFHQTLVDIFSGRRKKLHKKNKDKTYSPKPDLNKIQASMYEENHERTSGGNRLHPPPDTRLLVSNIIPDSLTPQGKKELLRLVRLPEVTTSTVRNKYLGYSIIEPDRFTPERTQRGFDTGFDAPKKTPPVPPRWILLP